MSLSVIPANRGIRLTNSWASGERPENARQGLMYLYPNGDLPLTALLSMMKSKKPPKAKFSDFTKMFPKQSGAVTSVLKSNGDAFTAVSAAAGLVIKVVVAEATALELRKDHVVRIRKSDDYRVDIACDVVDVTEDGATSLVTLKTLEAVVTSTTGANPAVCNRIRVIGSAQEEDAQHPSIINYSPEELWNYCQIFETVFGMSNTQLAEENLLTGDPWKEEKREKHEMHGIEIEKAFWWGPRLMKTVNGKPKRYTMGIIPMIKEYAPENMFDFTLSTDPKFAGKEWVEAGMEYLDYVFEQIFPYGGMERMAVVGPGARVGLTQLMRAFGVIQTKVEQADFGMWIETWYHNGMSFKMLTHPLFSQESADRNSMVIFEMKNIMEHPLRQTQVVKIGEGNSDGKREGWLTETGLFFKFPPAFAYLNGIGLNNTQEAA